MRMILAVLFAPLLVAAWPSILDPTHLAQLARPLDGLKSGTPETPIGSFVKHCELNDRAVAS